MPASFFKTMRLLLEFPKREVRAEGAIFNPFISKGGKKVLLIWNRDTRSQESRPVRGSGRTRPHIETPGLLPAGARTARTAEKRPVSCLLAAWNPGTSGPGSPEEAPVYR